jgi:hypothetical protein
MKTRESIREVAGQNELIQLCDCGCFSNYFLFKKVSK